MCTVKVFESHFTVCRLSNENLSRFLQHTEQIRVENGSEFTINLHDIIIRWWHGSQAAELHYNFTPTPSSLSHKPNSLL
jgi:hypothetical protein